MSDDKTIKVNDINYVIYKIGEWKNHYEINQIGLSREIPVSENTLKHVKLSMDEIRASQFEISDKTVNGFVAIAMQLNPKVQDMELDDVVELEQKEFENISVELGDLKLMSEDEEVSIESEDYLIYKLEKEHHLTNSIPANDFTRKFYLEEMKRIEDALS